MAHLWNKGFSMIQKMYGKNRFRYLMAGEKNGKILLIIKKTVAYPGRGI
jgi:hypothetical protein